MTRQENESRIPEFSSREEEAQWFDSHDMADYQDEFKTVKARFAKNLSQPLSIRFEPEVLAELHSQAKEKGIGPTTLVRMWMMEHLKSRSISSHDGDC